MSLDLAAMRRQYSDKPIDIDTMPQDPISFFNIWMQEAVNAQVKEPNAMILATVCHDQPDARIVLLKEISTRGQFVFYSNYASAKGIQIEQNPNACLVFCWLDLERQVRIRGRLSKYDEDLSLQYFRSRPRLSQLAAWASPQSKVIAHREVIDDLMREVTTMFEEEEALPLPPSWGGYALDPSEIEIWQGRRNRLHDRLLFKKDGAEWKVERLAP